MTIEQLPSGSYRITQTYKGTRYRVTVPHKPTKKEATILIAEKMAQEAPQIAQNGTVNDYAMKYMSKCEKDGKSPSTLRGYDHINKYSPEWFRAINLYDVTAADIQRAVNEYGETRAAKTVKLMHGFYHAVLGEYRPSFVYTIKLPTSDKKLEYEPTTKDIKAIVKYSEGTRYNMLMQLAAIGLRRGEAMCITASDINSDNVLTIDKDIVWDKNNKAIIKDHPKTSASYRRIPLSEDLANQIRKAGAVYTGSPHAINKFVSKAQDDLGIPHFRLHMFRHFAAAYLHSLGYSDEAVMTWMGWDEPSTMAKVYRYNLDPEKSLANIKDSFKNIF